MANLCAMAVVSPLAVGQMIEEERGESVQAMSPNPASPTGANATTMILEDVAERIVALTNDFRQRESLSSVRRDPELEAAARYFAEYMAKTDRYGHTADGKRPSQRAREHGYEYCIVSENIAYFYTTSEASEEQLAQQFVQGWIESPEHRKNMVDRDVTETGVAVAYSEKSAHYFAVQLFGRPKSAAIEFSVVNQSGEAVTYRLGEQRYPLPPRFIRTHQQCRPTRLTLALEDGPQLDAKQPDAKRPDARSRAKEQELLSSAQALAPRDGDRFVIERAGGELRIERERNSIGARNRFP